MQPFCSCFSQRGRRRIRMLRGRKLRQPAGLALRQHGGQHLHPTSSAVSTPLRRLPHVTATNTAARTKSGAPALPPLRTPLAPSWTRCWPVSSTTCASRLSSLTSSGRRVASSLSLLHVYLFKGIINIKISFNKMSDSRGGRGGRGAGGGASAGRHPSKHFYKTLQGFFSILCFYMVTSLSFFNARYLFICKTVSQ